MSLLWACSEPCGPVGTGSRRLRPEVGLPGTRWRLRRLCFAVAVFCLVAQVYGTAAAAAGPTVYFKNPATGGLSRSGPDRLPVDVSLGQHDRSLVGLALDPNGQGRLFFSDGDSVTRTALDGSDEQVVVPKVVLLLIGGVNFGATRGDLVTIEVHGVACTSTHFWSPTLIGCATADPRHYSTPPTVFDITVISKDAGRSGAATTDPDYATRRVAAGYTAPMVSSVRQVVRSSAPRALAYDPATATLLWSDTDSGLIHRSSADGSFVQLVATGLFEVYGMATANDMLYYTDHNAGRVVRVNLTAAGDLYDDPSLAGVDVERVVAVATGGVITGTGTSAGSAASKVLLRGFNRPRGIALDALNGHMYLTEASGKIFRARIDGRNMQRNPRKRPSYARVIARRPSSARLDGIAVTQGQHGVNPGRVFWTESNTNAVFSATTYGADVTMIAGERADCVWPRAIALLHEDGASYVDRHLFWTQFVGRVQRASTTGTGRVAVVDLVDQASGFAQVELDVQAAQLAGTPILFNVD